jgi:thioredoxin-related protein
MEADALYARVSAKTAAFSHKPDNLTHFHKPVFPMKKHSFRFLLLLVSVSLLAGAASSGMAAAQKGDSSVEGDTIAWFRGDVEQAFAIAKKDNKPLFLYWGAVWCPYCARIKSSVFQSRQFIALSELFVPYYLDGDTEQAQAVGERFGVKGYPTMIVLNAAGEEITRIPGGIDIDRYNEVLRNSLNSMQPTSKLLAAATSDPGSLDAKDYTQLAYYSWGQDNDVVAEGTDAILFRNLSEQARAVDEIASSRLFMQYLVASSEENTEETPVRLEGVDARLEEILRSDELLVACWDSLAYTPEIMSILAVDENRNRQLRTLWQDRLMALRHNPDLTVVEQLAGWRPLLIFHFEESEEPLSAELARQLDADIAKANESVKDVYARQGLVHQIKWTYQYAHMDDKAREILLAELDRSASPFYFMSGLGSLAEDQGNNEEAIDWYRKAYEASKGSATRLQWGASYVRALIRLAPDRNELIVSTADSLIDELPSKHDVFSGRNFRVLRRLNEQMIAWQAEDENQAAAQQFLTRIEAMCKAEAEGSIEKQNCENLSVEAEAAEQNT